MLVCGLPQGQRVAGAQQQQQQQPAQQQQQAPRAAPAAAAPAPAPAAAPRAAPAAAAAAPAAPPKTEPAAAKPVLAGGDRLYAPAKAQEGALLAIKAAVDPKGAALAGWAPGQGTGYCKWANVVCDGAGNVVALTLSYLGLDGALPPASALKALPRLEGLLLGGNNLKGPIPAGYGATGIQELYLNDNALTGGLPADLGASQALRELSLSYNQLSGPLPAEYGRMAALKTLKINSNKLSGAVPASWAGLRALRTLTLFDNPDLSGCLPAALAAAGPSGRGFFQARSGELTRSAKDAAAGTKISGFC